MQLCCVKRKLSIFVLKFLLNVALRSHWSRKWISFSVSLVPSVNSHHAHTLSDLGVLVLLPSYIISQ